METLELGVINAGFVLFALLILSTLVLGRFFCGWACHVVAYQDACAWLLARLGWKPRPLRSRLLAWIPALAAVYMFLWPQARRLLAGGELPTSWSLGLSTRDFWATFPGPGIAALTFFVDGALLVVFLGAKGFCTYGCPYGAVFGLATRRAPGRIRVNDDCEGCGHCTAVCTSNVRVHEEVAKFGQVVDPGCMRCTDCVSVCPKEALSFGFALEGKAAKRWAAAGEQGTPKRPTRTWDLSWSEEGLLAVAMGFGFFAFRGLYGHVPFLLALGLALMTGFSALVLRRTFQGGLERLQGLRIRDGGRLVSGGKISVALAVLWLLLSTHSGAVQTSKSAGLAVLPEGGPGAPPPDPGALEEARGHLERSARWGLFVDPTVEMRLGFVALAQGRNEHAEEHFERSVGSAPRLTSAWLGLGEARLSQGQGASAEEALREIPLRDPENRSGLARRGRVRLADALILQHRWADALPVLEALVAEDPGDTRSTEYLGRVLSMLGGTGPTRSD